MKLDKNEESMSTTFRLPVSIVSEIDRIATSRRMNRSQVIRILLDLGVDLHKDLERVGLIQAIDFTYYVKTIFKEKLAEAAKGKQLTLPF